MSVTCSLDDLEVNLQNTRKKSMRKPISRLFAAYLHSTIGAWGSQVWRYRLSTSLNHQHLMPCWTLSAHHNPHLHASLYLGSTHRIKRIGEDSVATCGQRAGCNNLIYVLSELSVAQRFVRDVCLQCQTGSIAIKETNSVLLSTHVSHSKCNNGATLKFKFASSGSKDKDKPVDCRQSVSVVVCDH